MARIAALMVVAVLAAIPAAASAAAAAPQQQLQNQVQEQPAPAPAPAPQPITQPESTTIGPGTLLLIGVVIVALLGGIWLIIARDARRATAGRVRTQAASGELGGSATRTGRRSRKLSAAERQRRKRGRAR